jgi:hypothetical protein
MRKKLTDEFATKAKKREIKKRPRMRMHGASLKKIAAHAGKKLTTKR